MQYYRFVTNRIGIYEAVQKEVSLHDERRKGKPDGSWLPKKGIDYPNDISFWTEYGLRKYIDSGLLAWHKSVIKGSIDIVLIERPLHVVYEDEYQIICGREDVKVKKILSLDDFLLEREIIL